MGGSRKSMIPNPDELELPPMCEECGDEMLMVDPAFPHADEGPVCPSCDPAATGVYLGWLMLWDDDAFLPPDERWGWGRA